MSKARSSVRSHVALYCSCSLLTQNIHTANDITSLVIKRIQDVFK